MKLSINIDDKKEVFEYLSKPGNNTNGRLTRETGFSDNFPNLFDEFKKFKTNNEIDNMPFIQRLWYFLQDIKTPILCKYCNKNITPFNRFKYGHQKYCCISCMNKDEEHKNNVNDSIISNFGNFENYFKIRNEKSEKTCLEKYGVKNAGGFREFVEKGMETKIQKYGSLESLYELNNKKKEKTLIKEYGSLENAYKEISIKRDSTNRKNHSGILYAQTEDAKKIISDKVSKKNRDNFVNSVFNNDVNVISIDDNNIMSCRCYECDCDECEEKVFNIPYHIYIDRKNKCLPICYKKYNRRRQFSKSTSKDEKNLLSYIRSIYPGNVIENDRSVLDGKEIDIYLPDINVGFEFNGDFWHCNPNLYDDDYINPISHKSVDDMMLCDNKKIEKAKSKGIRLYIIWEYDWINNEDIRQYIINCIYE